MIIICYWELLNRRGNGTRSSGKFGMKLNKQLFTKQFFTRLGKISDTPGISNAGRNQRKVAITLSPPSVVGEREAMTFSHTSMVYPWEPCTVIISSHLLQVGISVMIGSSEKWWTLEGFVCNNTQTVVCSVGWRENTALMFALLTSSKMGSRLKHAAGRTVALGGWTSIDT